MIEKNKVFVVSKNLQIYADLFGQSRSFLGSEVLGRLGEPVLISGPLYSVKKTQCSRSERIKAIIYSLHETLSDCLTCLVKIHSVW